MCHEMFSRNKWSIWFATQHINVDVEPIISWNGSAIRTNINRVHIECALCACLQQYVAPHPPPPPLSLSILSEFIVSVTKDRAHTSHTYFQVQSTSSFGERNQSPTQMKMKRRKTGDGNSSCGTQLPSFSAAVSHSCRHSIASNNSLAAVIRSHAVCNEQNSKFWNI